LEFLQHTYGIDLWHLEKSRFEELIGDGLMLKDNHIITLTTQGLLRADRIASELFILES